MIRTLSKQRTEVYMSRYVETCWLILETSWQNLETCWHNLDFCFLHITVETIWNVDKHVLVDVVKIEVESERIMRSHGVGGEGFSGYL